MEEIPDVAHEEIIEWKKEGKRKQTIFKPKKYYDLTIPRISAFTLRLWLLFFSRFLRKSNFKISNSLYINQENYNKNRVNSN